MQDSIDPKADWLDRVLGISLGEIRPAPPPPPPPETLMAKGRGVAYRKLLLRWRQAQATLDANLQTIGETLLAQQDVQADPRFEQVKRGVAALPRLVPSFGGKLEDIIDAAMCATSPADQKRLETEAMATIDAYRARLAEAKPLLELESFAARDLGARLPLYAALDEALADIKAQLST